MSPTPRAAPCPAAAAVWITGNAHPALRSHPSSTPGSSLPEERSIQAAAPGPLRLPAFHRHSLPALPPPLLGSTGKPGRNFSPLLEGISPCAWRERAAVLPKEGRDRCVTPLIYSIPAPAALRSRWSRSVLCLRGCAESHKPFFPLFSALPQLFKSFGAGEAPANFK